MSAIKKRVLARIEEQFKLQGGTGYPGELKFRGCCCALSAAVPDGEHRRAWSILEAEGLTDKEVIELARVHDLGIMDARTKGLSGIQVTFGDYRALYGTPAYEFVWRRLRKWAA